MKTLFLDLETFGFDFSADKGFILCGSYKWKGEKEVHTITRGNPKKHCFTPRDDRNICKELLKVIKEADLLVTWNGKSFDLRFLQTRLLKHRLGYLPPVPHEDGLLTARNKLKMRRSLENIGEFFGFSEEKKKMNLEIWMDAGAGNPTALAYVIKRCESDVRLLEEAYNLLAPLSKVHPNVALVDSNPGGCPLCGEVGYLERRGRVYALRHYRIRFQCMKCARWSTSAPIRKKEGD